MQKKRLKVGDEAYYDMTKGVITSKNQFSGGGGVYGNVTPADCLPVEERVEKITAIFIAFSLGKEDDIQLNHAGISGKIRKLWWDACKAPTPAAEKELILEAKKFVKGVKKVIAKCKKMEVSGVLIFH